MNISKHAMIVLSVVLVSLVIGSWVIQETKAQTSEDHSKKVEYLYVQTAHAVTFKGDKMTLHGVSPTTLFFSDRPDRIAGHGATEEVVVGWARGEDNFDTDPPNATLSILQGDDGEIDDVVVELQDPELKGSQLTYTVKVLNGKVPVSGGASALFIDIIGRPLTPLSVAGVARRTTRRTIRRNVIY
jgi:hypothetical protein